MNAIEIRNLEKIYKGGFHALKSIDIEVSEGDFFALLGPNGAGKTTIISIISNLVNKSSGQVKIFDVDIDVDSNQARRYLGVVPQEFNFNIFETVEHIVVNQAGYYGISRKEALKRSGDILKQLGLWDKRFTPSQQLSGGMKRRLMIARALIHRPKMLILDEPTAGVDIELRRTMWDFLIALNKEGTTIILTTHYLEEAEQLCRNIAILNHGQVIRQSNMQELLGMLDVETFTIHTMDPFCTADLPLQSEYMMRIKDKHTLEVDLKKGQHLTALVEILSGQSILVASIRNKSNRLEETFLDLIGHHNH